MLRRFVKDAVYALPSPKTFIASIRVLWWFGLLRKAQRQEMFSIHRIFVPHLFSKVEDLIFLLSPLEKICEAWPEALALMDVAAGIGVEDLFLRSIEPWSRSYVL